MVKPANIVIGKYNNPKKGEWLYPAWHKHSVIAYIKLEKKCSFLMRAGKGRYWFVISMKTQSYGFGECAGLKEKKIDNELKLIRRKGIILNKKIFERYINNRFIELL